MTNPETEEIIVGTRKSKDDLYHEIFERRGNHWRFEQEYLCDPNPSAISRMTPDDVVGLPPKLEGFEWVLGRKFTCEECKYGGISNLYKTIIYCDHDECVNSFYPESICKYFLLSDDTKTEIKLKDREIEETKIDTHPHFIIGLLGEAHDGTVFFIKKKEYYADCMFKTQIKLEIFL